MSWTQEQIQDAVGLGLLRLEGDYGHVDYAGALRRLLSGDFGDAANQSPLLNQKQPVYGFYEDWSGAGTFSLHLSFDGPTNMKARFDFSMFS
jgi:hypothetical protein